MDSLKQDTQTGRNSRLFLGAFALVFIALLILFGFRRHGVAEKPVGKPAVVNREIPNASVGAEKSRGEERKQVRAHDGDNELASDKAFPRVDDIAEMPSAMRARSIAEGSTGQDLSDRTAGQRNPVPMNTTRSRSAARSIALADAMGRLPAGYFDRENRSDVLVRSRLPVASDAKTVESKSDKENKPGKIFELHELPDSIRANLPALSLAMLVYSGQPGGRRLVVNGATLQEGQEITANLLLEEITPDGAIFAYQGYRFHKTVRGD